MGMSDQSIQWKKGIRSNTGDKLTGCMCPTNLPKENLQYICGHDLKSGTGANDTCIKQARNWCSTEMAEAIFVSDCKSKKCVPPTMGKFIGCTLDFEINTCKQISFKVCE